MADHRKTVLFPIIQNELSNLKKIVSDLWSHLRDHEFVSVHDLPLIRYVWEEVIFRSLSPLSGGLYFIFIFIYSSFPLIWHATWSVDFSIIIPALWRLIFYFHFDILFIPFNLRYNLMSHFGTYPNTSGWYKVYLFACSLIQWNLF